jgi:choline dehydrogenase-like flavoprotein
MAPLGNNSETQQGVVNPSNLHVWGTDDLMIGDLSVCPTIPRGNPVLTSLMIASRASALALAN